MSFLDGLTTEQPNPASQGIDAKSTREILAIINAEDHKVPAAVAAALDPIARVVDAVVDGFRKGGRLFYVGAGTSGRLGVLDASECPPTYGTPPEMVQGIIAGGSEALTHSIEGAEDDESAGAFLPCSGEGARQFVGSAHVHHSNFHLQRPGGPFQRLQVERDARIPEERHTS